MNSLKESRSDIRAELGKICVEDEVVQDLLRKIRARRAGVLLANQDIARPPVAEILFAEDYSRSKCEHGNEVQTYRIEILSDSAVPGEEIKPRVEEKYVEKYEIVPHLVSKKTRLSDDEHSHGSNLTALTDATDLTELPAHVRNIFESKVLQKNERLEGEEEKESEFDLFRDPEQLPEHLCHIIHLNTEAMKELVKIYHWNECFPDVRHERRGAVGEEDWKKAESVDHLVDDDPPPTEITIVNPAVKDFLATRIKKMRNKSQREGSKVREFVMPESGKRSRTKRSVQDVVSTVFDLPDVPTPTRVRKGSDACAVEPFKKAQNACCVSLDNGAPSAKDETGKDYLVKTTDLGSVITSGRQLVDLDGDTDHMVLGLLAEDICAVGDVDPRSFSKISSSHQAHLMTTLTQGEQDRLVSNLCSSEDVRVWFDTSHISSMTLTAPCCADREVSVPSEGLKRVGGLGQIFAWPRRSSSAARKFITPQTKIVRDPLTRPISAPASLVRQRNTIVVGHPSMQSHSTETYLQKLPEWAVISDDESSGDRASEIDLGIQRYPAQSFKNQRDGVVSVNPIKRLASRMSPKRALPARSPGEDSSDRDEGIELKVTFEPDFLSFAEDEEDWVDETASVVSSHLGPAVNEFQRTANEIFATDATIDDLWLAKVVLTRYARSKGMTVDELIEDVCDKMDAIESIMFSI
jgi:hypothetical protein